MVLIYKTKKKRIRRLFAPKIDKTGYFTKLKLGPKQNQLLYCIIVANHTSEYNGHRISECEITFKNILLHLKTNEK